MTLLHPVVALRRCPQPRVPPTLIASPPLSTLPGLTRKHAYTITTSSTPPPSCRSFLPSPPLEQGAHALPFNTTAISPTTSGGLLFETPQNLFLEGGVRLDKAATGIYNIPTAQLVDVMCSAPHVFPLHPGFSTLLVFVVDLFCWDADLGCESWGIEHLCQQFYFKLKTCVGFSTVPDIHAILLR